MFAIPERLNRPEYGYSRIEAPDVQIMDSPLDDRLVKCMASLKKDVQKKLDASETIKMRLRCAPVIFGGTTIPLAFACCPTLAFVPVSWTCLLSPFFCLSFLPGGNPKDESRLKLINECTHPAQQRELALTYLDGTEFPSAIYLADNITDPDTQSSVYFDIALFLIKREKNTESVTRIVEIIQKIQDPEIKRRATDALFKELQLYLKGIQDLLRGIETTSPISMETTLAKIAKSSSYGMEIRSTIETFSDSAPLTSGEKKVLLKSIGGPFITELMPLLV